MNKIKIQKVLLILSLLSVFLLLVIMGAPFSVDSASYVGSEKCKECHGDLSKAFSSNIHSKAGFYGVKDAGCESCHGPAGGHVTTGDKVAILNPAKLKGEAVADKCLECHSKDKGQMFWKGSVHSSNEVGCTSCHGIHANKEKLLKKADQKDVCFTCHYDVRSAMFKRSKHPLRDSSSLSE